MPIPGLSYTDEQLYQLQNAVLPIWVLLMVAPSHKLTQAACLLGTFFFCVLYTLLVVPMMIEGGTDAFKEMTTLAGVIKLFSNARFVFPAWIHYVAGDLWIGRWVAIDAVQRRMPKLLMAPVLLLTFLLGPMGLGSYLLIRTPFKAVQTKSKMH